MWTVEVPRCVYDFMRKSLLFAEIFLLSAVLTDSSSKLRLVAGLRAKFYVSSWFPEELDIGEWNSKEFALNHFLCRVLVRSLFLECPKPDMHTKDELNVPRYSPRFEPSWRPAALNARNSHFFQKRLPGSLVSTEISALLKFLSLIGKLPLRFKKIPGVMFPIASEFLKKLDVLVCSRIRTNLLRKIWRLILTSLLITQAQEIIISNTRVLAFVLRAWAEVVKFLAFFYFFIILIALPF